MNDQLKIFLINYTHTTPTFGAIAMEAPSEEEARDKLMKMAGDKLTGIEITSCTDVTSSEFMQKQMEEEKQIAAAYEDFMRDLQNDELTLDDLDKSIDTDPVKLN